MSTLLDEPSAALAHVPLKHPRLPRWAPALVGVLALAASVLAGLLLGWGPVAISTCSLAGVASEKLEAMLEATVAGLVFEIRFSVTTGDAESTIATAIVSPRARPRPSIAAETTPERA